MKAVVKLCMMVLLPWGGNTLAQSLELMPGTENLFVDAQWLKSVDQSTRWSIFSRTRATVDYDNNTDLFTGAYLNYTTKSGLGGSVIGRISSLEGGADVGIHYFKASKSFLIFALPSIELSKDLGYSWFSIARYTPTLSEKLKLYTSLELFTLFNDTRHALSVQRLRAGIDLNNYQFGLAINLSQVGTQLSNTSSNPGVFVRKQF